MSKIFENKIQDYNSLKNKLYTYKGILTREMLEYLESLLELEVSVLRKDNIDLNKENVLSELKIFRDIAAYNIYSKSKLYVDNSDNKYELVDRPYNNGITITTKDLERKDHIIFSFNYTNSNVCLLHLYSGSITSVHDRALELKEDLEKYRNEIKIGVDTYHSAFMDTLRYVYLKTKIDSLENITFEDLQEEYKMEELIANEKNLVINNALKDFNLDMSEFSLNDGILERKNSFSKILIK